MRDAGSSGSLLTAAQLQELLHARGALSPAAAERELLAGEIQVLVHALVAAARKQQRRSSGDEDSRADAPKEAEGVEVEEEVAIDTLRASRPMEPSSPVVTRPLPATNEREEEEPDRLPPASRKKASRAKVVHSPTRKPAKKLELAEVRVQADEKEQQPDEDDDEEEEEEEDAQGGVPPKPLNRKAKIALAAVLLLQLAIVGLAIVLVVLA